MEPLVSIITPLYNGEKYISKSIESVLNQSYKNWEMIIVNDVSTDKSVEIVEKEIKRDSRIKLYHLEENSGPAVARNLAIQKSLGSYIAFLDGDDLWHPNKLSIQINFMETNGYNFSCTDYEQIDSHGNSRNRIIKTYEKADYNLVLKKCPVGNSTVIINVAKLGKPDIYNIKKRNDYLLWLQILKKEKYIYGVNQNLGYYRIHENNISSGKFGLVKYHWHIYRKIEKLSFFRSVKLIIGWGINKFFRIK